MTLHKYDLDERLLEYAASIIRIVETLQDTRAGSHIATQLLRSGTSPLPNHGEAEAAESRKDFIHKMGVCHKELRESRRWLRLIQRVPLPADAAQLEFLLVETDELVRIFAAGIRTAKANETRGGA
jgi:four helix bundle protein